MSCKAKSVSTSRRRTTQKLTDDSVELAMQLFQKLRCELDKTFGEGYAADNPQLVGALVTISGIAFVMETFDRQGGDFDKSRH